MLILLGCGFAVLGAKESLFSDVPFCSASDVPFSLSRTVVAVVQALAASEVGDVNVKLWGYDTNDIDTVKKYVESMRDAYQKSSTPTIKHLIEITHDTFEKTPRPGIHTPVGNPPASEGLDTRAPEGGGARGSRYWLRGT